MKSTVKLMAFVLIAILLFALIPVNALAMRGAAVIPVRGLFTMTVTDEAGKPIAGARYDLYRHGAQFDTVLGSYSTDKNGELHASHLTTGSYFWMAVGNVDGYMQDEEIHFFRISGNQHVAETVVLTEANEMDYLVLVNKQNALPSDWEETLITAKTVNSLGDEVVTEKEAYAAYLKLKGSLAAEGVYVDLDSAYRSVAEQQAIMDRFTEQYGADYAAKTVAEPGHSEHHTGLALDLYLNIDGEDVYYNEDMVQYPEIWAKIHAQLADYGFILRYPEGKEHITGYGYEPWHIRYVGDPLTAHEIEDSDLTLEGWLGAVNETVVVPDFGTSALYTMEELTEAAVQIKCRFAFWTGCELHTLVYMGDECCTDENVAWLNEISSDSVYTQVCAFKSDFHSPVEAYGAWEADMEYTDWQWWLGRTEAGSWELVTWGY